MDDDLRAETGGEFALRRLRSRSLVGSPQSWSVEEWSLEDLAFSSDPESWPAANCRRLSGMGAELSSGLASALGFPLSVGREEDTTLGRGAWWVSPFSSLLQDWLCSVFLNQTLSPTLGGEKFWLLR